jgi:hypothetical protein
MIDVGALDRLLRIFVFRMAGAHDSSTARSISADVAAYSFVEHCLRTFSAEVPTNTGGI